MVFEMFGILLHLRVERWRAMVRVNVIDFVMFFFTVLYSSLLLDHKSHT